MLSVSLLAYHSNQNSIPPEFATSNIKSHGIKSQWAVFKIDQLHHKICKWSWHLWWLFSIWHFHPHPFSAFLSLAVKQTHLGCFEVWPPVGLTNGRHRQETGGCDEVSGRWRYSLPFPLCFGEARLVVVLSPHDYSSSLQLQLSLDTKHYLLLSFHRSFDCHSFPLLLLQALPSWDYSHTSIFIESAFFQVMEMWVGQQQEFFPEPCPLEL